MSGSPLQRTARAAFHRSGGLRLAREALKLLPNEARLAALGRLPEMLAVRIPQQPPLAWEELRKLAVLTGWNLARIPAHIRSCRR